MRTIPLGVLGVGFLTCARLTCAAPEDDLRDAYNRWVQSGNYSWELRHEIEREQRAARPTIPIAAGETIINGYSIGTRRKVGFVTNGQEMALNLQNGWRHLADFTEQDRAEVKEGGLPSYLHEHHVQAVPHEVFAVILPAITGVRKEGAAFMADLDTSKVTFNSLYKYIVLGEPPAMTPAPRRFGLFPRAPVSRPPPTNERVEVVIWMAGGQVASIVLSSVRQSPGSSILKSGYRFDVFDVGKVTVIIPPEAKALFLGKGS